MTHAPAPFTVELRTEPARAVVAPHGELDMATVDRVRADVEAAIHGGASSVEVDLRGVSFMDSSGLRMLFALHAAAERAGVALSVREGDRRVGRVLELSGAWSVLRRADAVC